MLSDLLPELRLVPGDLLVVVALLLRRRLLELFPFGQGVQLLDLNAINLKKRGRDMNLLWWD